MQIRVKRVYTAPTTDDGLRVLVDRLWPRGLSKEKAKVDEWEKELAPSTELRQWFGHEPDKWEEFHKRYSAELEANPAVSAFLAAHAKEACITLVYGAKDEEHNQAIVLKEYLERVLFQSRTKP